MRPALGLPTRALLAIAALGVASLAVASCTQDFDQFFEGPAGTGLTGGGGTGGTGLTGGGGTGGTGLTGGGGTGGTGLTGGGGTGGCSAAEECPGVDTTCSFRTCDAGQCGMDTASEGTACTEDGGQVCDDSGNCVECLTAAECQGTDLCDNNVCVPAACSNQQQDGDETDVDCGGPDCAPCANGLACLIYSDCESLFCDVSGGSPGVCSPCTVDGDCTDAVDTWCDGGSCEPQKQDGDSCGGGNECLNGYCPGDDGVCCNAPCTVTCRACLQAKTGSPNGTCDWVTASTDPDNECAADTPDTCGSNGDGCSGSAAECVLYDSSTVCAPASCTGSTLYSEQHCNGSGTCVPPMVSSCAPYVCNGGGTDCLASCQDHGDCTPGNYCDSNSECSPLEGPGFPCGNDDAVCQNGNCVDGFCCDTACTNPCLACSAALTGGSDGTCAPALAGCSCEEQYSGASGYFETCGETATDCTLRVTTQGQSCENICESAGGECLGFYNDQPNGTCGLGGALNCWDQGLASAICVCSRGCGGNAMCVTPDTCIGGTCQ